MYSIIVPYFKNDKVINRCLDSIDSQTIMDYEVIIVDDGSNDNIKNIIDSRHNPKIKLIQQHNQGVSQARNVGIKNSLGNWICFLDSDDTWETNHLSTIEKLRLQFPKSKMFITSHTRISKKLKKSNDLLPISFPESFITDNLFDLVLRFGEIIHTNSVCVNKNLFQLFGYFEQNISIGEDTDLWYRLALRTSPVLTKKVTTNYYRDNNYLTKLTKFSYNWPFYNRTDLINNSSTSIERQNSANILCLRYQLSICKHYISESKFVEAQNLFHQINKIPGLRKSIFQVRLLLVLPKILSRSICKMVYRCKQEKY